MKKMHKFYLSTLSAAIIATSLSSHAAPCPFDNTRNCTLQRNILTDVATDGLKYFAPTNYDHRFAGEVEIFDASLVQPYTDNFNVPGQIKLTANLNGNLWKSGEIMTRRDLVTLFKKNNDFFAEEVKDEAKFNANRKAESESKKKIVRSDKPDDHPNTEPTGSRRRRY